MNFRTLFTHNDLHYVACHLYANDWQLHMYAPLNKIPNYNSLLTSRHGQPQKNLRSNENKTEFMLHKEKKNLHNSPTSITIGNAKIQ